MDCRHCRALAGSLFVAWNVVLTEECPYELPQVLGNVFAYEYENPENGEQRNKDGKVDPTIVLDNNSDARKAREKEV